MTTLRLYPVMDGLYASSANQTRMLSFLRNVLQTLADEFNNEADPLHRFIVRGGLAFGPTYHGHQVGNPASPVLAAHTDYRDQILLGLPMVQAHISERQAPPFGLFVHESARSFAPDGFHPLHYSWFRWSNPANRAIWDTLSQRLSEHLQWCADHSLQIGYPPDRVNVHREMVRQFFS